MRIALIGYGKMGHMIEQIALGRGHEVVCRIDVDNQEDFQSEAFRSADVSIEFTAPAVAFQNVQRCFEAGVKVVSGSTGWFAAHAQEVERQCREQGHTLLWASNFSVGVGIFAAVNRHLARLMNQFPQYDVELEETHHVHKLDHPSGTAITLAEDIVREVHRKQGWAEATVDPQLLRIDAIRRGEVAGIHTVRYDSEADLITIRHEAHNRKGFALGAVLAAEWAAGQQGLLTIDQYYQHAYGA